MPTEWTNLFLQGPIGAGKTTLLFNSIDSLNYHKVGGFAVKRIHLEDKVVGMEMVDLMTGSKDLMMSLETSGKRNVNLNCFLKVGVPAINEALAGASLVIMDELGRFELAVPDFLHAVETALNSKIPVIGVLKDESNPFLDGIRSRSDVRILGIEVKTRDLVAHTFRDLLAELIS